MNHLYPVTQQSFDITDYVLDSTAYTQAFNQMQRQLPNASKRYLKTVLQIAQGMKLTCTGKPIYSMLPSQTAAHSAAHIISDVDCAVIEYVANRYGGIPPMELEHLDVAHPLAKTLFKHFADNPDVHTLMKIIQFYDQHVALTLADARTLLALHARDQRPDAKEA